MMVTGLAVWEYTARGMWLITVPTCVDGSVTEPQNYWVNTSSNSTSENS